MSHTVALLEVVSAAKSFGGIHVIRSVSFSVGGAESIGLVGPNGAGKTTLFNLISGVCQVDRGQVRLDGVSVEHKSMRARAQSGIARTFQNLRLAPDLTVLENVLAGVFVRLSPLQRLMPCVSLPVAGGDKDRLDWALSLLGLQGCQHAPVDQTSYGTRKKVELARALMARPRLLMLDEPAAGLNGAETAELVKIVREVQGTGIGILVVEHDMRFIREVCDRVNVLHGGHLIAQGTFEEIAADHAVREAYLGKAT